MMSSCRSCRVCANFVRIEEDYPNKIFCRGFCLLGQLEGDFSLYVSSSKARDCSAFLFSDYNYTTTLKERELNNRWLNSTETIMLKHICEGGEKQQFTGTMQSAYRRFIEENKKEFEWLMKRDNVISLEQIYRWVGKQWMDGTKP